MTSRILLALDGSEPSMKAARYVAALLANRSDIYVTLFHVLATVPTALIEAGGLWILSDKSDHDRHRISWTEATKAVENEILEPARELFKQKGFRDQQLQIKCIPIETDVAHDILKECENGNYDTVVIGKRGLSRIRTFLTGSVTEKVVRHADGRAVWVIE